MASFSDQEIEFIQRCLINKDFTLAAFHMLNKSMLSTYRDDEKQERIERLAEVLEETSPLWPDLEVDIVRIISEKFLEH